MQKLYFLSCLMMMLLWVQHSEAATDTAGSGSDHPAYASWLLAQKPLLFAENRGQVTDENGRLSDDILFIANDGGTAVYITATGIIYQFAKAIYPEGYRRHSKFDPNDRSQRAFLAQPKTETYQIRITLEGGNNHPHIRKELQNAYTENFYLAHCPDGITGVRTYERIVVEDVYPGIDWVLYSRRGGLKYDFVVHAGADPALIKLKVSDPQSVAISGDGRLIMTTPYGSVTEEAPLSFSGHQRIGTRFNRLADGSIGFALDAYDPRHTLTIDPAVSWATYFGGSSNDDGFGCVADRLGNVYMSGPTGGSPVGIASSGAFQTTLGGGGDAYLVKFSSNGMRLWATYYGGSGQDVTYSSAIDDSGNVFMAGWTTSPNVMATPGSFQTTYSGNWDMFLVKFTGSGTRSWGTYFGSSGDDWNFACAADHSGNSYIGGYTNSSSGITSTGAYDTSYAGNTDAVLAKFSSTGTRLWSTYYGGSLTERILSCAVDDSDRVYIAGYSDSPTDIASAGAHQTTKGPSSDAFLAKFSSTGSRIWGTYFGGTNNYNTGYSCAVDHHDHVFLAGTTSATGGIATPGAYQTTIGGMRDAFLVKFWGNGTRIWSTYFGGSNEDIGAAATVDSAGDLYMTGTTQSVNGIATPGAAQTRYGGILDAFLVKFRADGVRQWSTYYGRSGYDGGYACAAGGSGHVFLAGGATSDSMASAGAFDTTKDGTSDAFLVRFADYLSTGAIVGSPFCAGDSISVPFTGRVSFNTGNVFTAQLSDSTGTFGAPVTLGTLSSNVKSDSIKGIIPPATLSGVRYRVRVISSSPAHMGIDNVHDLIINRLDSSGLQIAADSSTTGLINGQLIAFRATYIGGGLFPGFQWYKNGSAIPGAVADTFRAWFKLSPGTGGADTISNGDSIRCEMVSDLTCVTDSVVTSNTLIVSGAPEVGVLTGLSPAEGIVVYPNPTTGRFTIYGELAPGHSGQEIRIALYNTVGQLIFAHRMKSGRKVWREELSVGPEVQNGVYHLQVTTPAGRMMKCLVLKR